MLLVIYLDLLIVLNFIIDCLLLISVDVLLKRKAKFPRIFVASLIGGLSIIVLFYINGSAGLLAYKFITSVLMVIIAFKYENFHYFKENLFWLYIISIILGGSIYLLNNQITLTNNALIFNSTGFTINVVLILAIGPIIIYKYLNYQKKLTFNNSNLYEVDIYYKGITVSGTGFLDTGNKLVDPYFHRPIILVNKELLKKPVKGFFVPYKVLNDKGLLEVFKPDKILISGKISKKALIGISDVNLNGVKIILNMEAIWEKLFYGFANY